jgi:hypothetical protein
MIVATWQTLPVGLAVAKIPNRPDIAVVTEVGVAQNRRSLRPAAALPDLPTVTGAGPARHAGGAAFIDCEAARRVDNNGSYGNAGSRVFSESARCAGKTANPILMGDADSCTRIIAADRHGAVG